MLNLVAACSTGAVVIFLTNPLDCVKSRWQMAPRATFTSIWGFARHVVCAEGVWRGLWLPGLATNCLGCAISVGSRLGFYPALRDKLQQLLRRHAPGTADGGGGGGAASGVGMFLSGLAGGALGYLTAAPLFYATRVSQAPLTRSPELPSPRPSPRQPSPSP